MTIAATIAVFLSALAFSVGLVWLVVAMFQQKATRRPLGSMLLAVVLFLIGITFSNFS